MAQFKFSNLPSLQSQENPRPISANGNNRSATKKPPHQKIAINCMVHYYSQVPTILSWPCSLLPMKCRRFCILLFSHSQPKGNYRSDRCGAIMAASLTEPVLGRISMTAHTAADATQKNFGMRWDNSGIQTRRRQHSIQQDHRFFQTQYCRCNMSVPLRSKSNRAFLLNNVLAYCSPAAACHAHIFSDHMASCQRLQMKSEHSPGWRASAASGAGLHTHLPTSETPNESHSSPRQVIQSAA